ncbi:sialidase family protein [uncultured Pseudoteredinibacter sp.]|uniref:sialidase family protein n=1 Tax=uncultured Pseudoteredinibacter sp. TaxID=1641701 RepID=UPI0026194522|nr:sialidase family protein [uncultured Pseudoteredinibacter sp.]
MKHLYLLAAVIFTFFGLTLFKHTNHEAAVNYLDKNQPSPYKRQRKERQSWIHGGERSNWQSIERLNLKNRVVSRNIARKNLQNRQIDSTIHVAGLQGHWLELGSQNQAGRMLGIDYNGKSNELISISDGGHVWLYDANNQWHSLNDTFRLDSPFSVHWLDKTDNTQDRIIAVSRVPGQVHYSDDRGFTWNSSTGIPTPRKQANIDHEVISSWESRGKVYLLKNIGHQLVIFSSEDRGETFSNVTTFNKRLSRFTPRAWHSANNNELYIVEDDENRKKIKVHIYSDDVLKSVDGPTFNFGIIDATITGSDGVIYLAYEHFSANGIVRTQFFESEDGGSNWRQKGSLDGSELAIGHNNFAADSSDKHTLYFGGVDAYVSRDGANSWQKVNYWHEYYDTPNSRLHADITFFYEHPGHPTFISTDGGIYKSIDQLSTVENISLNGLNVSQYYDVYTAEYNPHQMIAGSQDQGFQLPRVHGKKHVVFDQLQAGDIGLTKSSDGGRSVWLVFPDFLSYYVSMESREREMFNYLSNSSWSISDPENPGGPINAHWMNPIVAAPDEPNAAYIGIGTPQATYLWKVTADTELGQSSVEKQPFDFSQGQGFTAVSALAISNLNNKYRYVVTNHSGSEANHVFTSVDGGRNWKQSPFQGDSGINHLRGIVILPSKTKLGRFYLSGSYYSTGESVYVSEDNGQTFQAINNGLPNTLVRDLEESPDGELVFAATDSGPFVYSRSSGEWTPMHGLAAPETVYTSVEYVDALNLIRFSTYGRGIWDFHLENLGRPKINGSYSGLFYEPAHNGEGMYLQVLSDKRAIVAWFTYDDKGNQSWLLSTDGKIEGDTIIFKDMFSTSGSGFGPEFKPESVENKPWGQMALTFESCTNVWMSYSGPNSYGRGYQNHIKLAGINGLSCQNEEANSSDRGLWTGAYYNKKRSGEGIFLQEVNDELAVITFFGYDNNHQQMWLIAEGQVSNDRIVFDQVKKPINGQFGPHFDPNSVERKAWGRLLIEGSACDSVTLRFEATDKTITTLDMVPLSKPQGLVCE